MEIGQLVAMKKFNVKKQSSTEIEAYLEEMGCAEVWSRTMRRCLVKGGSFDPRPRRKP